MRALLRCLLCYLTFLGCTSGGANVRADEPSETAFVAADESALEVFFPAELRDWEPWSTEELEQQGWVLYFVEFKSPNKVELAMARRPQRPGGRGGRLSGRAQTPLLNPRPTREQLEARRRQAEDLRAIHLARERYLQALQEAKARYPEHHGY